MNTIFYKPILLILLLTFCTSATAATIDGKALNILWCIPFAGILLSIALCPLFLPKFWHHHFGKLTAVWAALFLIPCAIIYGIDLTLGLTIHTIIAEYIPFLILLLALFTVSGGIFIEGNLQGTPKLNTGILLIGTLLASLMGTTGAAMLLIRPLLRANDHRQHRTHVVIFFIFLVANIGGGLTPLGDPPLFLGFLKGIDFFWTMQHMLFPVAFTSAILLVLFYIIDTYYYCKENKSANPTFIDPTPDSPLRIQGKVNFILLILIVLSVLLSGIWKPSIYFDIMGTTVHLQNIVRDTSMLAITIISLLITPRLIRRKNEFTWGPIQEIAKLFAGIFITIIPAIAILQAGSDGVFSPLISLITNENGAPINIMYFWITGTLSSFLDNAPTYLVFFNTASGNPAYLMDQLPKTLLAISMGSVFMGAMTYIGNAPNFMVNSIATQAGVAMPSFLGYMKWSLSILLPVFILLTFIMF